MTLDLLVRLLAGLLFCAVIYAAWALETARERATYKRELKARLHMVRNRARKERS